MAGFDLNEEFDNMSEKAKAAAEKLELAADETQDRAAADVAIAEDKTSEAVDRLKKKVETTHETASEHREEGWAQRLAHDGGDRHDVTEGTAGADPKYFATTPDPIDFADPSVDEAQEGVLDALDTRGAPEPPAS